MTYEPCGCQDSCGDRDSHSADLAYDPTYIPDEDAVVCKGLPEDCLCLETCGDIPEEDDPFGACKGLPYAPKSLVEIALTRRWGFFRGLGE
jgi:hypothetical protein